MKFTIRYMAVITEKSLLLRSLQEVPVCGSVFVSRVRPVTSMKLCLRNFKLNDCENSVIVGPYEAVKGYPYFGCPCSVVLYRQNLSICVWRSSEFMA